MAITKTIEIGQVEIVGQHKHVQVRTATVIKEDGVELNRSFHRKTLECGYLTPSGDWVDKDISGESADVKAVAAHFWTQSVKDAWKAKLIADKST